MQLNPEFLLPYPPHFGSAGQDREEKDLIGSLSDNLRSMKSQCENVVADIVLFQFCTNSPDDSMREWPFLAGRDGAMCLRNYKEALSNVRGLLGRCTSICDYVDAKLLREVEARFDTSFPRVEKLRHSVAHPELYSNPKIKMSSDEPISKPGAQIGAGAVVQGSLMGRTFVCTINGLTVEWEICHDTAQTLVELTKLAFSAFAAFEPRSFK